MQKIFTLLLILIFLTQTYSHGKIDLLDVESDSKDQSLSATNFFWGDNSIKTDSAYPKNHDAAVVEIYPNPFSEKFMLNLRNFPVDKITLNIYDYIGNSVFSTVIDNRASNNSYEVDVTRMQLRPGMFFLKIEGKGLKTKVVRLIKQ